MTSFPLFVSRSEGKPHAFDIYAVLRKDLGKRQVDGQVDMPSSRTRHTAVVLESEGHVDDPVDVRAALHCSKSRRFSILAADSDTAQWFIISYLTVPKSKHEEIRVKFHSYVTMIFDNATFKPVFSYLAPLAYNSDVLLSVWAFQSPRDAEVYMPSKEHVAFAHSVKPYITDAEFFQAARINLENAKL